MWLYRILWLLLGPAVDIWFFSRLFKGKEDKKRWFERLGKPSQERPAGKLVWLHGASVGETLSLLPLIENLLMRDERLNILVTSGTVTSAGLMTRHLPELDATRVIHQYAPLDFWLSIKMFVDHWQPCTSVFVESDFWPEMVYQAPNPVVINARMSERSFKRYQALSFFFAPLFTRFKAALAQSEQDAKRLRSLGFNHVKVGGNLKFDARPLGCNESTLAKLEEQLRSRKVLVAASTHPGEEEAIAAIHKYLQNADNKLTTIIIPRHPHRGAALKKELAAYQPALRSEAGDFPPEHGLYIADTLGEMGLWYRLADVVFVGGSLIPHGGQNPLEPVRLGVPTFCGPHMQNFHAIMQTLQAKHAITQCASGEQLKARLTEILSDNNVLKAHQKNLEDALKTSGEATQVASNLILENTL